MSERIGVLVLTAAGPGILHQLTGVIARHRGDIASVEIASRRAGEDQVYFEVDAIDDPALLLDDLRALPVVRGTELVTTMRAIYGKRVIIMGGGAQAGPGATGPLPGARRHNTRGERISADPTPLVGEQPLADAVRAVARLPRASA